jgi:excisionase family DNA binding protein
MNKKEAAERLGISTRQVEHYVSKSRLTVTYVRGKTGREASFDESEVKRLKAELEAPVYPATALQAANSPATGLVAPQERERFLHVLEALTDARRGTRPSIADLAAKPLLTLAEAQTLTGLSRQTLRDAIDSKKLKAKIIGKGWKIKRSDLNSYIAKL